MDEFEKRLSRSLTEVRDSSHAGAPDRRGVLKQELFRRMHRRRIFIGVGGMALAGAAIVAVFVVFSSIDRSPVREPELGPVEVPAPARAVVDVGDQPTALSVGGLRYVWSTNVGDNTVSRIDPATNQVIVTGTLSSRPGDIAIGNGPVWVALPEEGTIVEVNASSGELVGEPLVVSDGPVDGIEMTVGAGALWAVVKGDGVIRFDLETREPTPIDVAAEPTDLAVKKDAVRLLDESGAVYLLDPATGEEIAPPLSIAPAEEADLTVAAGSLWHFVQEGSVLSRLDLGTGRTVADIDIDGELIDFVIDPEVAWVLTRAVSADSEAQYFLRPLDVSSNELGDPIRVEGEPAEAVIAGRSLWLSLSTDDAVLRFSKFP